MNTRLKYSSLFSYIKNQPPQRHEVYPLRVRGGGRATNPAINSPLLQKPAPKQNRSSTET